MGGADRSRREREEDQWLEFAVKQPGEYMRVLFQADADRLQVNVVSSLVTTAWMSRM